VPSSECLAALAIITAGAGQATAAARSWLGVPLPSVELSTYRRDGQGRG
jgi:hypothetical protein